MGRPIRLYSILAATAAWAAATLSGGNALAFSAAAPARVLYVGDSLAAETLSTVTWWTQLTGKASTSSATFPGMAICDFLESRPSGMPIDKSLKSQVRRFKPHLVVMQFWGNSYTDCIKQNAAGTPGYYEQYYWDALAAVEQITAAAAQVAMPKPKILWVLQGPDRDNPDRVHQLNDLYTFVATRYSDRTTDAGYEVSALANPFPNAVHDRYAWTQFLPCTDLERREGYCTDPGSFGGVTRLHRDSDPVHFCVGSAENWAFACNTKSAGILRYGTRIALDVNIWLGI